MASAAASLHHPGDSFSYDIFSQAGQAIRAPSGPHPLGDLKPKRVIAIGESQSAFRLVNYVDGIHPIAHVYDGFLRYKITSGDEQREALRRVREHLGAVAQTARVVPIKKGGQ